MGRLDSSYGFFGAVKECDGRGCQPCNKVVSDQIKVAETWLAVEVDSRRFPRVLRPAGLLGFGRCESSRVPFLRMSIVRRRELEVEPATRGTGARSSANVQIRVSDRVDFESTLIVLSRLCILGEQ